ncbi:hypothetical protein CLV60_12168 [Dyadobacter jiangsuensis]|uniref:Uncharacterized protein n=1 Tax=Dyadobacter jiangsuensis TaxID=1591085 RepID=A0A2P8FIN4_9BACT|nr:hypothetical protein CLV60_12168 [Dyadobacter jiangsuensis]
MVNLCSSHATFKGIQAGKPEINKASKFIPSEYERLKAYYEEYIDFGGFPEVVWQVRQRISVI